MIVVACRLLEAGQTTLIWRMATMLVNGNLQAVIKSLHHKPSTCNSSDDNTLILEAKHPSASTNALIPHKRHRVLGVDLKGSNETGRLQP